MGGCGGLAGCVRGCETEAGDGGGRHSHHRRERRAPNNESSPFTPPRQPHRRVALGSHLPQVGRVVEIIPLPRLQQRLHHLPLAAGAVKRLVHVRLLHGRHLVLVPVAALQRGHAATSHAAHAAHAGHHLLHVHVLGQLAAVEHALHCRPEASGGARRAVCHQRGAAEGGGPGYSAERQRTSHRPARRGRAWTRPPW